MDLNKIPVMTAITLLFQFTYFFNSSVRRFNGESYPVRLVNLGINTTGFFNTVTENSPSSQTEVSGSV